jgi:hypothetical protein
MAATIGKWVYVWCECHVRIASAITVVITYQCAACDNSNLRFIHVLECLETKEQIWVGIECAGVLLGDFDLPRLAENEVKRKERWRQHYRKPGRCIAGLLELESRGKV